MTRKTRLVAATLAIGVLLMLGAFIAGTATIWVGDPKFGSRIVDTALNCFFLGVVIVAVAAIIKDLT